MTAVDIEKLNQLISRTDISGNDKVKWLTDFIDGREFEQQQNSYSEEEAVENRIRGINVDTGFKQDSQEYDLLQHIKFCLVCNNESQAIRLIEKYGFQKQERSYSDEEVLIILDKFLTSMIKGEKTGLIEDWFEQFKNK
jgi:hypothetical protein